MMEKEDETILAIDAAVSGGSLSLIGNGVEEDSWIGSSGMARAEDLLANIDKLVTSNRLSLKDIDVVAVSAGPGSFTGIRIGIATAQGLATGLGIALASESALNAMALNYPGHATVVTAVPAGRETVCYQRFDTASGTANEVGPPQTERESDFLILAATQTDVLFVLQSDLFKNAASSENIVDFGSNLAFAIGLACRTSPRPNTEPLFISKSF